MANMPDLDKRQFSIFVTRELFRKLKLAAQKRKMTLTEFVRSLLYTVDDEIELTAEDYREIANEIEKAQKLRDSKRCN